jgi:hypothetical protein
MKFVLVVDIVKLIEKLIKKETPEFAFTTDIDVEIPDEVKDKEIVAGLD